MCVSFVYQYIWLSFSLFVKCNCWIYIRLEILFRLSLINLWKTEQNTKLKLLELFSNLQQHSYCQFLGHNYCVLIWYHDSPKINYVGMVIFVCSSVQLEFISWKLVIYLFMFCYTELFSHCNLVSWTAGRGHLRSPTSKHPMLKWQIHEMWVKS